MKIMTEPLGWENWSKVYLNKKNKKRASLERYGLRNLHTVASLDFIVSKVESLYFNNMPGVSVSASSIWIDGTPQAKFTTDEGKTLNCELADLLFIIREVDNKNTVKNVRAVLLQGKCSEKNHLLPDGPSTEKERKLLESINRNETLTLYPGTKTSGNAIGEYKLGGHLSGLADCAKYLIMPKYERWNYKTSDDIAPYVIGWPQSLSSKSLGTTTNYIDSIISEMLISKTMGKNLKFAVGNKVDTNCEWSKMIDDLLTSYNPITMKGYDCQRRVYESTNNFQSDYKGLNLVLGGDIKLSNRFFYYHIDSSVAGYINYFRRIILNNIAQHTGPVISTILIYIKHQEEEILRPISRS
jgi:hypothetical protein